MTKSTVPPFFSTGIEPLARMTQYLTDNNALGDAFGAAIEDKPFHCGLIWSCFIMLYHQEKLTPRRNRGVARATDSRDNAKNGPKREPLYRSLGQVIDDG